MRNTAALPFVCVLMALAACGSKSDAPGANSNAAPTPEPLLAIRAPTNLNAAKVALGRRLFHDPILSGDNTLSCASCHSLDTGGAEHKRTSDGIRGQSGPINSPTVLNSSLNFVQFWDGRAATLEEQAAGPMGNPLEMGSSLAAAVTALQAKPVYVQLFAAAYPDGITATNLTHAIAEYERSLITPAPFDRFLGYDGPGNQRVLPAEGAISPRAKRGYETFKSVGCTTCHTGRNVGGSMYQKMGLVRNYFELRGTPLTEADNGRFNVTHQAGDRHMFKVPTLRNVALTAPYFHDGTQRSLEDAVKIMGQVQLGRELTEAQIGDIVAFLESLTGVLPEGARPTPDELPAVAPLEPSPLGDPPANADPLRAIHQIIEGEHGGFQHAGS